MKKIIALFIASLLINFSIANSQENLKETQDLKGSISIYHTPELNTLTNTWANEFGKLNPDVKIKIKDIKDASLLNEGKHLGFISKKDLETLSNEKVGKISIGREVIVPIINSDNPFIEELYLHGVSSNSFAQVLNNYDMQNWGTLLNTDENTTLNYYMLNDESINSGLKNFLNLKKIPNKGIKVSNKHELILSIQNDPNGIGFCKVLDIIDFSNQTMADNIKLLPIDRNGNGQVDHFENIYDNLNDLTRGIWIGKYPKALSNDIYSIIPVKRNNDVEVAFLKWVLTDGQQYLSNEGFNDLLLAERQSKIDRLYNISQIDNVIVADENRTSARNVIFVIIGLVVGFFVFADVIRYIKYRKASAMDNAPVLSHIFDKNSLRSPGGVYYDKTHTWAYMEKDGIVKVGIDDFLQRVTGPLSRIKMKQPGERIKKGDVIFSIAQSGKQINVYAPITGTIKAQNKKLNTNSSLINSSPYQDGWVYMVEPTNWLREIQFLLMVDTYKEWIGNEFARLKDFLSSVMKNKSSAYDHLILQDGGELEENILAELGPEVWEDFQTNFIDTSK